MDKQEILKGNHLIAIFYGRYCEKSKLYFSSDEKRLGKIENLMFHSSWDWIMPVAEKISENFDFILSSTGLWVCYVSRKDCDWEEKHLGDMGGHEPIIINAFKAIVQFIEWYNKQPKYKKHE